MIRKGFVVWPKTSRLGGLLIVMELMFNRHCGDPDASTLLQLVVNVL